MRIPGRRRQCFTHGGAEGRDPAKQGPKVRQPPGSGGSQVWETAAPRLCTRGSETLLHQRSLEGVGSFPEPRPYRFWLSGSEGGTQDFSFKISDAEVADPEPHAKPLL